MLLVGMTFTRFSLILLFRTLDIQFEIEVEPSGANLILGRCSLHRFLPLIILMLARNKRRYIIL